MIQSNSPRLQVIVALVTGIAFIVIISIMIGNWKANSISGNISTVTIPLDASSYVEDKPSFEPQELKVVIGINNTVRWINHDSASACIEADNTADPNFYNATKDFVVILPNHSFEYTFKKLGTFGYHGAPWQRGNVTVTAGP